MKQYKEDINQIHWTKEGKENLMLRVKSNSEKQTVRHRISFAKYALVAAVVCVFSATAYATGVLQSAVDVLSPIFGGTTVQTEIIEKIGHPVGASDTEDGITISADAIIGDKSNVCVVYSIKNSDGTTLTLPEGVEAKDLFFSGNVGTELPIFMGSVYGSSGFEESTNNDGSLQIVERLTTDKKLPIGKNVTAKFSNLSYFDKNNNIVELSDASWEVRYKLNCEDVGTTVSVDKQFARNDLEYSVKNVDISPISIGVNYTVNAVMKTDYPSGKESDEQSSEMNKFLTGVDLIITKNDGTTIDVTESSGGSVTAEDGISIVQKGTTLNEIIPLDQIESVTVGDIVVPITQQ